MQIKYDSNFHVLIELVNSTALVEYDPTTTYLTAEGIVMEFADTNGKILSSIMFPGTMCRKIKISKKVGV